jgi:hypothetical protein
MAEPTDRTREFYERGVRAARQGRFMAADHFFQRAVAHLYGLHGAEGQVHGARHIARIYTELGLARMAARHYRRALALLERAGGRGSVLFGVVAAQLEELNGANLSQVLAGLGILSPGNGPVTDLELHCGQVLDEVRAIAAFGAPDDAACARAAQRLNAAGVPTGRGGAWTAQLIRTLCEGEAAQD